MSARRTVLWATAAVLLAGCSEPVQLGDAELACRTGDGAEPANGVVLMAQAVDTASFVPCLDTVPLGWHLSQVTIRDGSGRFSLESDRTDNGAIKVALTPSCSTGDATEIPSDREGVRRFEQVGEVTPGYHGTRFYVFDGGCLAIRFGVTGDERIEPLAVAGQGIGLLRRTAIEAHVREETDGRLELDPVPEEGS